MSAFSNIMDCTHKKPMICFKPKTVSETGQLLPRKLQYSHFMIPKLLGKHSILSGTSSSSMSLVGDIGRRRRAKLHTYVSLVVIDISANSSPYALIFLRLVALLEHIQHILYKDYKRKSRYGPLFNRETKPILCRSGGWQVAVLRAHSVNGSG